MSKEPFDPVKAEFMLSADTDFLPLASMVRAMYNAYRSAGFRAQEALTLTTECIKQMLHDTTIMSRGGNA